MLNLIFDCNFICIRSANIIIKKYPNLFTRDDGMDIFMKSVINDIAICIKWNNENINTINFVFDSGSTWRSDIDLGDESYKEGRKEKLTKIDWKKLNIWMDHLKDFLMMRSMLVFQKTRMEGDDFLFVLSEHYYEKGQSVLIFTGDGDARQMLKLTDNQFVAIYDHHQRSYLVSSYKTDENSHNDEDDGIVMDELDAMFDLSSEGAQQGLVRSKVLKGREINPAESLFLKIVSGDKSDKVPSCFVQIYPSGHKKSFGEDRCQKLFNKHYHDIRLNYFENLWTDSDKKKEIANHILSTVKIKKLSDIDVISKNINRNLDLMYLSKKSYPDEEYRILVESTNEVLNDMFLYDKFRGYVSNGGKFMTDLLYKGTKYDLNDVYAE